MGKKLKDNDFDELQCLQCTVPMVDSVTYEDAFETQVPNLAGETQVLDDPDGVVNICTQLLDDCGNEVVDTDGGESDGTEVLDDCAELSDDDSLKRVGTCPMDQGSKLHATISDQDDGGFEGELDNGQWSSGSGQKNFTSVRAASLRASGLAARSMAFRGTESEPSSIKSHSHSFKQHNAKDNGITLARNSSALGEAVDQEDFSGECNEEMEEMKGSRNENKCRVGSSIVRRLFMDDTPDEIEGPNNCTNNATRGADLPQLPARGNEMAGLSYVDSQEPGELSQDNALDFVDRFLKSNAIDFDEGGDIGRSTGGKSKPVSRTKRTHSLARKTNLKISAGESGIFDWDDSREDERGGEFFTKKKEAFFNDGGRRKRSFTEPQKLRHYSKRRGAVDGTRDNEEGLDVLQKPKGLVNSNPGVVLQSSKWNNKIVEVTEIKSDKNLTKELDERLIIGSSDGKEATLDVGFDTQMAAEAMEALCFGLNGANCDDSHNTNQGTKNLNEGSSRGEKKNKALSRTYFRRKRSNSSCSGVLTRNSKQTKGIGTKLINELNVSARKHAKNARKQCNTEFERKELKKDKSNGNMEEVPSEGSGQMEVERALRNDIDEVDRCHAIASSSGCISAKKSHSEEQACTFTPIACRTRQRSMRNRVSTVVASHDYGEAGTLNDRRQEGSADGDAFTLLSRIEKLSKLNSNRSGELENAQLTDQDKSHRIWSGTIAAVRNGDLRRTRRKLPGNSGQLNGSCNGHRSVYRLVGQENNGQSLGKTHRSEITASSPSMDLGLKRKTWASAHVDPVLPTLDTGGSGFADLMCNSVDGNVVPKDVAGALTAKRSDRQSDADTISAGEGAGRNAKLEVSPGERSKPSGSAPATPANSTTPVNASSPICVGDEYLKQSCRKNLSRSFLKREINSLISNSPDGTSTTRDSRRRRDMANVRVLFSHHLDEDIIKQQQKILARLGASVASSISEATHFVTDKFVRTRNILEAIAFGKPVMTHLWIESCGQVSCFIDERNYILRDAKKEKEFGFSLPVSLERACQRPLLQGQKVLVTPNAKPGKELLVSLVKAVRGQALERIGRSAFKDDKIPDGLLVLSCEEDYALCLPFLEKGAAVHSSELLLNGIVTQKLEFERHRLFVDRVKNTRSTIWLKQDSDQYRPVTKCK